MNFKQILQQARAEWEALKGNDNPRITIGMASCSKAARADAVLEAISAELERNGINAPIIKVGCIGLCYAEPIINIIKSGRPHIYYGNLTPETAAELISDYLLNDNPRPDLALGSVGSEKIKGIPLLFELPVLKPQVRVILRNCGIIDPENINHYIAQGGYQSLHKVLTSMTPQQVIDEVKRSGLRGRGGAGFPTGLKWQFCYDTPDNQKYLICNADEGDPGAFMDRSIMEGDPHSVIEGMAIAAHAIGASEGYIYIRAEYPLAVKRVKTAINKAEEMGFLGKKTSFSNFSFNLHVKEGAGAFVCGEETALMASIEGKRGMPHPRPPFPAQYGLWGKPTNINNVKSLASVPAIISRGADWYNGIGSDKVKGTAVFALAGKIVNSGLVEVPMGISLHETIFNIGGGVPNGKQFKAVQTGGPSGGCLPESLLKLPVDYESLTKAGSIMGSGGMVVMDDDTCMVDIARYFLAFTQSESCGKCTPCRLGTKQMLGILEGICNGKGTMEDIDLLLELAQSIKLGSLCGLGQTALNPVLTTLRYFREEYEEHIKHQHCRAAVCKDLVTYSIIDEKCPGCGLCIKECPVGAITSMGKKKPVVIDKAKCTNCGACYNICRLGAVEIK